MDLLFNITDSTHKQRLNKKIESVSDYIDVKLSILEILMSFWSGNPTNPRPPYIRVRQENEMMRVFIVGQDKISSFGFEYRIKTQNKDFNISPNNIQEFYYRGTKIGARAISEAKTIYKSYNSRCENIYCYTILDIDEPISDEAFILFESLFMAEPGYIRYDHDVNNADPATHPLDHLDVNFSKFVHYKLGLSNRISEAQMISVLDNTAQCQYLTI